MSASDMRGRCRRHPACRWRSWRATKLFQPRKRLDQLQRRGKTDAALADQRRRLDLGAIGVAAAREADADLVAAEQRMLVLGRGVLLIDEFPLPAAVSGTVGAEIIEERVAAEDAAVLQQHHAGLPAGEAVQHPDVDRVEPANDAAFADRPRRRDVIIAERRHHRAEHRAGVFQNTAGKMPDLALRLAANIDGDLVGADQPPPGRRWAVTPRPQPGDNLAIDIIVGSEMGKGRIAAEHGSGVGVQHAAAGAAADVVFDLVKPLHRARPGFVPSPV
jgi:hypothetical protein